MPATHRVENVVVTGCGNENGKGLAACFLLNVANVKSSRAEINKVSLETRNIYSQRGSEKFTITSESRNLGCGCVRVCLFICLAPSPPSSLLFSHLSGTFYEHLYSPALELLVVGSGVGHRGSDG